MSAKSTQDACSSVFPREWFFSLSGSLVTACARILFLVLGFAFKFFSLDDSGLSM